MARRSTDPPVARLPHGRKRSRTERILRWTAAVVTLGLVVTIGAGVWFTMDYVNASLDTVGKVDFDRRLDIPPLVESTVTDGVRTFDLTMQSGESDLGQGGPTATWGINGAHLAPTIRAARGERVEVRVTNDLNETSTLHWHGMHLPAEMDGGPHQSVPPGAHGYGTYR